MNNNNQQISEEAFVKRSINTALRIGFIFVLFLMSYFILKPFIAPVLWGIIIAVAVFPLHKQTTKILGNREKLSAILLVVIGLSLLMIPAAFFADSAVKSMKKISIQLENGTLAVPPPEKSVADWPVVGKTIYSTWELASNSLSGLFDKYEEQLKEYAPVVLKSAAGLAGSILVFFISIVIAGALLVNTKSAEKTVKAIFKTLAGADGDSFATLASSTIRSVVKGVLGTAVIQTFFISIGMFVVGVPGASIITIIVLVIAIVQLPLALVMIPIIIYVFSYANFTLAVIFAIWSLAWGGADTYIKSLLLGKGVEIPVLVLLLGAMGGMMFGGIMGLFMGAVLLAFAYKVFFAIIQVEKD